VADWSPQSSGLNLAADDYVANLYYTAYLIARAASLVRTRDEVGTATNRLFCPPVTTHHLPG